MATPSSTDSAITPLTRFKFFKLLNTDQQGRRIILQGTIDNSPALLLCERAAFSTENPNYLTSLPRLLKHVQVLGENDVYHWYLANLTSSNSGRLLENENGIEIDTEKAVSSTLETAGDTDSAAPLPPPDVKINLIFPATEKHFRKFAFQQMRVVVETPEVYVKFVRPWMEICRGEGRLNWVENILEGRSEEENVLFRSRKGENRETRSEGEKSGDDGFLLLPDLNWDRKTMGSLHLLVLVERRDLWSVRDLRKRDVEWLRRLRGTLMEVMVKLYPDLEGDMLKFYVHYQPTYYHFHVHVVHVNLDATGTQAVGKALGLDHIISQLENMAGGDEAGMHQVELSYTVGESSELWQQIFLPLKEGREPTVGN